MIIPSPSWAACQTVQAERAAEGRQQLAVLAAQSQERHRDGFSLNKQLRAALRTKKKADAQLDARRQALGLPEHVKLLPESAAEQQQAQIALMQQSGTKFQHNWQNKRQKIMTESIFGGGSMLPPPAAAAGSSRGLVPKATRSGSSSSSAKDQLTQRLLAAKRKKQQI